MKDFRLRWVEIAVGSFPLAALIFLVNPALILFGEPVYSTAVSTWLLLGSATAIGGLLLTLPALAPANGVRKWIAVLYKSSFLVLFLVTIFYPEGGRRLDGVVAEAPSTPYLTFVYLSFTALVVVVLVVFLYRREIAQGLFSVSLVICALIVSYQLVSKPPASPSSNESTVDLEYATDSNVVFILADMLQGSTVEQILQTWPHLKDEFSGFKAYTRAVSPFPFTSYGVPAILSGKPYAAPVEDGQAATLEAARRNSFLAEARQRGYDTVITSIPDLVPSERQSLSAMESEAKADSPG